MSDRIRPLGRRKVRRRWRLRVWSAVNLIVLSTLTYGVAHAMDHPAPAGSATGTSLATMIGHKSGSKVGPAVEKQPIPTKADYLDPAGKYFGVMADNVPWNAAAIGQITKAAGGVAPNMSQTFTTWVQDFPTQTVIDSYANDELPVISWEPWAQGGTTKAQANQPAYALSQITAGRYDAYITTFAEAAAAAQWPVVLRFAHEMNGDWYPWSEGVNGNGPGSYVAAWRHVHDIFTKAGANNVIWMWSPNILRGAQSKVSLAEIYPGDGYVDWIGFSAYDDHETTATALLGPTTRDLRSFTQKPLLISETGAQPGSQKLPWTSDFLTWVNQQPGVIGFIWSEYPKGVGGATSDWGFSADPATQAAFDAGIKPIPLMAIVK